MEAGLSVVIPTRDRPEALARCLDSLDAVVDGSITEVIVVDNGSRPVDSSRASNRGATHSSLNVVVVRVQPSRGPAHARNVGANHASGHLLWFIDDDVTVPVGTPNVLLQKAASYSDAVLGGAISIRCLAAVPRLCESCAVEPSLSVDEDRRCGPSQVWSSNLLVPRTVFDRFGGFSADALIYGEELEFLNRVAAQTEIWQVAGAPVEHLRSAEDLAMFAILRRRWIRGRNQARNARRFGLAFPARGVHLRRVVTKSRHALRAACFGGVMDAVTSLARAIPVRQNARAGRAS